MLARERGCRVDRALAGGIWLSVVLLLLTFYPGAMSIDSYTQLVQARSGHFGDWHPPFMAWLWRRLDAVVAGPLLMMVTQIGLLLIALHVFARAAPDCGSRGRRLYCLAHLMDPANQRHYWRSVEGCRACCCLGSASRSRYAIGKTRAPDT